MGNANVVTASPQPSGPPAHAGLPVDLGEAYGCLPVLLSVGGVEVSEDCEVAAKNARDYGSVMMSVLAHCLRTESGPLHDHPQDAAKFVQAAQVFFCLAHGLSVAGANAQMAGDRHV